MSTLNPISIISGDNISSQSHSHLYMYIYTHSKEWSQQQTHGLIGARYQCALTYLKSHLNCFPSKRTICAYVCICVCPPMDNSTLKKCKGHFNPRWVTSLASVQRFLRSACKGHFNPPSWVLSVADVSIMAQLANLN